VMLSAGAPPAPPALGAITRVGAGGTNRTAWLVITGAAVAALGAALVRRVVSRGRAAPPVEPRL
ncbi:MAG: hypothetical protein O3B31_01250, partial [Chloroflexi bacterium]|nr:hypothetical protein [Chloroflexota bacterium]